MARSHGRIQAVIWDDADFLALDEGAQRMFMFLLSQPDLSHAGLIPLRARRWARKATGMSSGTVRDRLDTLAHRGFVVFDEDTEELLIRTMVRNDGVYKQPKVMIRMREDARQIESPRLRAAFRAEIDRLPLDELSDRPGGPSGDLPSTRAQVEAVVDTLRADFEQDRGYPSEGVSDTPHVRARAFHQPPTTIPQPPTTDQETLLSDKSDEPDRFEEFWDAYDNKIGRKKAEAAYRAALKKPGVTPDLLITAAAEYVAYLCSEGKHPQFTKNPLTWLHGEHWTDERSARTAAPTRTQQHLALARQLAAEESGHPPIGELA